MGLLDALGIGNQTNQLSLPEILSAIPAVAGPVLMQRGRRVGLPLGIGLTALGGLGETLADRQRTQAQHQNLAKMISGMPGITDEQKKFLSDYGAQGGNLEPIVGEVFKRMFGGQEKSNPYEDWRRANPNAPVSDWFSMVQSTKPTKTEKATPFDLWRQQNPKGTIADWEKLTHPAMSVNVESPIGGVQYDANGNPVGVLEHSKTGTLKVEPAPPGLPKKSAPPTTPAQALANRNRVLAAAKTELANTGGFLSMGAPSAAAVQARARDIAAHSGLDADGYPLKDGQKVKMSDGTTLTWRNP